jgi:hypothetical protein
MAHVHIAKTSFASGEVSSWLIGRGDLRAYENGAAKLRNVYVHPTGGLIRRAGLRYVATARGRGRMVPLEFNTEQVYLLVFSDRHVDVYQNGVLVAVLITPWQEHHLSQLCWAQSADTLLIVTPDVPPQRITRHGASDWRIATWTFALQDNGRIDQPHYKFADAGATLQPNGTAGTVSITARNAAGAIDGGMFRPEHVGVRLRLQDKELQITQYIDGATVHAYAYEYLVDTNPTRDWTEQSFSNVRGYPTSVSFHQDRLVIGGSRDLPNRLWLSKSSDLFNFNQGEGLDDDAIEFSILSDQLNAIRAVFSGRHLQVFTSGAEWMVTGDPLTPTNIQLHRQTRVGSPTDRTVPPRDVDGATVYVPRNSGQLREFLFADVEQAYQSTDLAILSQHLVKAPVDIDYDQKKRLLQVVMADGTLGTLTMFRAEQVAAWTLQETRGKFLAVAVVGDDVYVLVDRDGRIFIEIFEDGFNVDSGLAGHSPSPNTSWSGLDHLEGQTVKVLSDGAVRADQRVVGGSITLDEPATSIEAGLAYTHVIEPLPTEIPGSGGTLQGRKVRPVAMTFRLQDTSALQIDVGYGLIDVPFKQFGGARLNERPEQFTGDKTVRAFGWRADGTARAWLISQDTPLPFKLMSVVLQASLSD